MIVAKFTNSYNNAHVWRVKLHKLCGNLRCQNFSESFQYEVIDKQPHIFFAITN